MSLRGILPPFEHLFSCCRQAVSVKDFRRFLNKAVTIAANDHGTNTVFVEAAHTANDAWNSNPIEVTDITCCVPDIGHPFRVPFDLSLRSTQSPTSNQAADAHAFLRLAIPTTQFTEHVLCLSLKRNAALLTMPRSMVIVPL
jgi:hypothetical protein